MRYELHPILTVALHLLTCMKIWSSITSKPPDPSTLTRFILITYADLKKCKYYYCLGFPTLAAKRAWTLSTTDWLLVVNAASALSPSFLASVHAHLRISSPQTSSPYFLVRPSSSGDSARMVPYPPVWSSGLVFLKTRGPSRSSTRARRRRILADRCVMRWHSSMNVSKCARYVCSAGLTRMQDYQQRATGAVDSELLRYLQLKAR